MSQRNGVWPYVTNITRKTAGTAENPAANKLHNVTSRLMSNTTRKYIFTEYWSSIIQYLNDPEFDLSMTLKVNMKVPLDSPYMYIVSY